MNLSSCAHARARYACVLCVHARCVCALRVLVELLRPSTFENQDCQSSNRKNNPRNKEQTLINPEIVPKPFQNQPKWGPGAPLGILGTPRGVPGATWVAPCGVPVAPWGVFWGLWGGPDCVWQDIWEWDINPKQLPCLEWRRPPGNQNRHT